MFIINLMFDIIILLLSAILVHSDSFLYLYTSYYSSIILTKFVTYYSQNYAGIIGSGLTAGGCKYYYYLLSSTSDLQLSTAIVNQLPGK